MKAPREVPSYTAEEFEGRTSRFAVAVFVLNEGDRIRRQVARMQTDADGLDVILADGGSTDGALELEYLRSYGVNTLLTKTGPGRLSAQMRMAMAFCLDRGYEGIVVVDGNNKDDTSALPAFRQALADGFDHIQGSRFIPGGKAINTPWSRYLAVRLIHAPVISLAAGQRCTDTTNGFRAYSRRLLEDPRISPLRDIFQNYELHYYLAIRAARLGFRTLEIPVTRRYPPKGRIPTKISPVRGNLAVLRTLYRAATHQYDPEGYPS